MSLTVLVLVQWLHILMGITWFGGYIFLDFVIWPMLLKRPAAEAQAVLGLISRYAGPLMMVSGTLVILLGIARGLSRVGFFVGSPGKWDGSVMITGTEDDHKGPLHLLATALVPTRTGSLLKRS